MPALTSRPLGFSPSPPTIAELYFCIHAYQAVCRACNSSGDGWDLGAVESRKMNKNFAMMVLQTVSQTRAEACPPPCVNTTNKLQPFGHRHGKKKNIDASDTVRCRVRRHLEREVMPDAWRKVIRGHPLGQRGAVGEGPPYLHPRLRNQNLSLSRLSHSFVLLDSCF